MEVKNRTDWTKTNSKEKHQRDTSPPPLSWTIPVNEAKAAVR